MLRRDQQVRTRINQLMDACLYAVSFWLAHLLRSNAYLIELFELDAIGDFDRYVWLYLVLIPVSPLVLESQGFYDRPVLCSRRTTAWPLFKASVISAVGLIIVLFFSRLDLARSVAILFGAISFVLVFLREELTQMGLRIRFAQSQFKRRFILVGAQEDTAKMRAELKRQPADSMEVLAELNLNDTPVDQLVELLHEHSVNGVIINAKQTYFDRIETVIMACEREGVEAWLVADFFKTQISRTSFDDFHGRPVMVFRTAPESSWQSLYKQVFDVLFAFLCIVLLSPLFLLVALGIKLTSPGPILFRQQRCGLNGHPFTIFKFRTMVTNAEQRKHELTAMNEMSGPVFKVSNDPRIIPIGRFLRRFSIDEWPQFFNVLRGEMSLVGPRPLPIDEVKRFDDVSHRRRLSVKPGITCLWQVSGRNNVTDFEDWVRLDLEYIDNWSFWLDLEILWRTVPIVLTGTGAK
jgi:exopolysaccharide biosynthesis polyprenyl glycosylphosphotransferase